MRNIQKTADLLKNLYWGPGHNSPSAKSTVNTGSDDVASYTSRSVSDADKYRLLKHHFQPNLKYKFSKASNGHSFQHICGFETISPGYCTAKQKMAGGFCLPCVLFATGYRGQAPGVLVSRPMNNFQKTLEQTEEHKKKDYHTAAVSRAEEFQEIMAGKQMDIKSHIDHGRAERI